MNRECILPRRCRTVPPVEHGGPDLEELRRLGLDPTQVLDFSVCTNPLGPSPRVYEVLTRVAPEQYPDREAHALRTALADMFAIGPRQILAANGASELIWLAALAFVRPKDRVLVIGPAYGEYARSVLLQGGMVTSLNARQEDHFALPAQEIEAELERCRPCLVFFCNPNNPTGTIQAPEVILSWARRNPRTLFVVDEAYQRFVAGLPSVVPARADNLLVLRSMTKDYALAGLRIGYAVGPEHVIDALAHVRPPWSVNAMAQAAAVAALSDEQHLAQTLKELTRAKQTLVEGLTKLGMRIWPSTAHFFLVLVGNGPAFRQSLLMRGILVRDASSFGLPAFVRLAPRLPQDNARLLAVFRDFVAASLS